MIMADADGAIKWVVIDWEKKDGEVLSSVLVEALPVGKITLKLKEKKVGGAAIMMAKDSTASKETNLWEGKIIGLFGKNMIASYKM